MIASTCQQGEDGVPGSRRPVPVRTPAAAAAGGRDADVTPVGAAAVAPASAVPARAGRVATAAGATPARGARAVSGRLRLANAGKWLAFGLALLPLANLFWRAFDPADGLGANPVEVVTRSTGYWSLVMLCLTLLVTPLRRLLGWQWLVRWRRMLGLYAFFHAVLHVLIYLWLDQGFALSGIIRDILDRPFILVGALAFAMMVPLAITSTQGMIRRLGRRWGQLHRLVYPMLVLAVLHYFWLKAGKNDLADPLLFAGVAALLLGVRICFAWRQRRVHPEASAGRRQA